MTAPTRTRRKPPAETPSRTRAKEATRVERRPTRTGQQRTTAAERAYARRAQRVDLLRRTDDEPKRDGRKLRLRWPRSRASFVLIVMTLLAAGVVTTLLLSTQAIADSYRLEQIREENSNLAEQSEQLQQGVTKAEAASSLAARAKALGMVPAGNPAHLVQNPDGSVTVVGTPEKAVGQAPPPPSTAATPPPANPPGTAPIEGDVPQGDEPQPPVVSAQAGGQ
ncbi:outer membrane murein-binding lipoprotein Lpp [Amycolatopsis bartoniae]|uniref:Cell division protein FtsL n=1 Tax=Amycolatopsis bartoniae TaxID=941986 RepID=A0A8H9J2E7_9PSEU|nr:hypothetical protein [Amycolatopsis bartoniae]MBB2935439.1 outer membrane murein-binding lipoprotein Lpp [Amycolatopsis bartoniae]TVT03695.1 hypothetical protein FNH07_24945 [Amycolatopsis bartoniae]GHF76048.1 hypothetical protein GCM10017566_57450 [Amycolatopsis bartoniae]